jgi:hypothetical protein
MLMMKNTSIKSVIILACLSISLNSFNQNTGPVAPEAMSFEPVDATDMVNLITGDLSYVLPLMEVPGPEGGYPIVLSYHGGVAMDQEASWVGLGWNINPGALNRNVVGFPDDFKNSPSTTLVYDDDLGTYTSNFVGVSLPPIFGPTVGVRATWGSSWSVSGFVGIGALEASAGYGSYGGFGSVGFNLSGGTPYSAGAGISISNQGISPYMSLQNGSFSASFDFGSGTGYIGVRDNIKNSIGISLGSGSSSITSKLLGTNLNNYSPSHDQKNVASSTSGWVVPLYFIEFGSRKTHYWYFDEQEFILNGILYNSEVYKPSSKEGQSSEVQDPFTLSDTKMLAYSNMEINPSKLESEGNLLVPSYDNYSVNAQGLNGNMALSLFEAGLLVGHTHEKPNEHPDCENEEVLYYNIAGFADRENEDAAIHTMPEDAMLSKLDDINPYFYFNDNTTSTIRNHAITFTNFDASNTDPVTGYYELTSASDDGYSSSTNINNSTGQKYSGNYVQYFTNEELYNNLENAISKGFIETSSIAEDDEYENPRENQKMFPKDGIGAFIITTPDGLNYHYALPVYQFQEITRNKKNGSQAFLLKIQEEPYAYTWLLTAITGPDYVDNGSPGIDNSDYGYWIQFDYGKWSDAFMWKTPYEETENYRFGIKQIYYLNSISTRTHTAYFIKDVRNDGKGASINEILTARDRTRRTTELPGEPDGYITDNCNKKTYGATHGRKVSFSLEEVKPLKLDRIILVKNEDVISAVNDINLITAPSTSYFEYIETYTNINVQEGNYQLMQICEWDYDQNQNVCRTDWGCNVTYGELEDKEVITRYDFSRHCQDNVFDVNDTGVEELQEKSIKTIVFDYDTDLLIKKHTQIQVIQQGQNWP